MSTPEGLPDNAPQPRPPLVSAGEHDVLFLTGALDPPQQPGVFGALGGYPILRQVGSGGMGIVFESCDPETGARVALKLLRPELAGHGQAVHRFLVEARHMRDLAHPHILPVTEVHERPQGPFYVMPFMEGGSLAARLGQPLDRQTVTRLGIQIGEALMYAHVKGLIHRDIKPANILLDGEGRAYLGDFGLVRTMFNDSNPNLASGYEGTAPYMSPHVAAGLKEDTRCDIYSFGAMLYEMLTGKPPYEGRSTDEVARRILGGPPEPIRHRNPRAPAGLVKVAEGCMARELRDRYAEMADVVADLRRFNSGEAIVGPHGRRPRAGRVLTAAAIAIAGAWLIGWALTSQRFGPSVRGTIGPTGSPATLPLMTSTSGPVVPVLATHPAVTAPTTAVASVGPAPLPPAPVSPLIAKLAATDPAATTLSIDEPSASDADLIGLEHLTRLQFLKLRGQGMTDACLAHVRRLVNLRSLNLRDCRIEGRGLDYLDHLPQLEELFISNCPLTDAGVEHLVRLGALRRIRISDTRIDDAGLLPLRKLKQLTDLDLWGSPITDAGLAQLAGMRGLHVLGLRGTRVTVWGLGSISGLKQLAWLDLRAAPLRGPWTARLYPGPLPVASFAGLAHLDLSGTGVEDADLASLAGLKRLRELNLDNDSVSDAGVVYLAQLPELDTLGLCDTAITDDGVGSIAAIPKLKTLYLDGTRISDAGLLKLQRVSTLRTLHLTCPNVTDTGVEELRRAMPLLAVRR